MKKSSNTLTLLALILILTISASGTVLAAQPSETASLQEASIAPLFKDIDATDLNALYINYLAHREIMKDFPDGNYHPAEGLTRAQAATIIVKTAGLKINKTESSPFKDLKSDHWAASYINSAARAGYLKGFPDGSFKPDKQLTRAEGISLILRLSQQSQDSTLPTLKDISPDHWASSAIATALEAGMIGLSQDGTQFLPENPFSRGSLARALAILLTKDPDIYIEELQGKIKPVEGQVTLTRNGESRVIKEETLLQAGDTIKSSAKSSANIDYPDGSAILIKENTEISIKESQGRATIKKDGTPGTAVDWLNFDMKQGTIFSALATRHQNEIVTKNVSQKAGRLFASLGLISLNQSDKAKLPWYQTAEQKKVKVKVDMPYGVAAVRGTFVSISVEPSGKCEVSCLTGDAEVSSRYQNNQHVSTVTLQGGQSSSLGKESIAPEPPAPLNTEQKQQFIQEKTWVETTAQNMDKNQEAIITPAPAASPVASLSVQTVPQLENTTNQTQQALSTLQIVQEAMGTGSTPAPVQPNNPVNETPSPSNPEKSLGQTVPLNPNQPVRFSGGIKLDLGSMAIPQGASVKITEVPASSLSNTTGLIVAGKILDIDIQNFSLTGPVELSLPVASGVDAGKAAIYYYNNGTWEYQPSSLENGVLKARLSHFSTYAVLIDETPPTAVQINKGSSTTSSIELILSASDAGGVVKYQIYRDGELLTTTTASTYTDTGLESGRSYIYKIKAIDRFGNTSEFSPQRQAACTAQTSSNAKLSSLSITPGSLSPSFSPDTLNYTANVANNVSSITISAAAADAQSKISINGATATIGTAGATLALNEGSNSITVRVTAKDGINNKENTINVSRETLPPAVQTIKITQVTANPQAIAVGGTTQVNVSTNPSGVSYSFTSNNTSIAAVNTLTGLVTGISPGIASIKVTASKDGYTSSSRTISVTVYDPGSSGGDVSLRISPASYPASSVNQLIPVEVKVEEAVNLYALEIHISFDLQALAVVNESGQEVSSVQAGDIFASLDNYPVQNYVDQASGKIHFAISCLGQVAGQTGNSTVCPSI